MPAGRRPDTRRPAVRPPWRAALLVALAALVPAACGDDGAGAAACGPATREALDPSSVLHLLPGAPEPEYRTDPPTSGPHQAGGLPTGVQATPLPRPVQVGLLERGVVVVQHTGLDPADVAALDALAGPGVVVAPAEELPAAVVATAWTWRVRCDAVDVEALRAFVDERGADAPDGHVS